MKLKIFKGNELVMDEEFFNKITIQNLLLHYNNDIEVNSDTLLSPNLPLSKSNPSIPNLSLNSQINNSPIKELHPYHISCFIDLSELKTQNEISDNLEWVLRIYSPESVMMVKDTSKEDSEKFLKDNWETIEPGRSDKARKSRLKHLITCKKNMGKLLTLEEEQLLLEERPRTVSTFSMIQYNENVNAKNAKENEKEKKNLNDNNRKGKTKNDQNVKTNKNLPVVEQTNKINEINDSFKTIKNVDFIKRPIIVNPNNHKSHYIKKFLHYTEQERIIRKDNIKNEENSKFLINNIFLKAKLIFEF